jgi:ribonuclease D
MRRPLPPVMLYYAVADVTGLLKLADSLMRELKKKGLMDEFQSRNLAAQEMTRTWDPFANYTRIPGFSRLRTKGKRLAKLLWYARELYAQKQDQPAGSVASKEKLRQMVDGGLHTGEAVARFLKRNRRANNIDPVLLESCLRKAGKMLDAADKKIRDRVRGRREPHYGS